MISQFYSCYKALYGRPDYQQLVRMLGDNSLASLVRLVVEADLPEEPEVPAGLPEFAERLYELGSNMAMVIMPPFRELYLGSQKSDSFRCNG